MTPPMQTLPERARALAVVVLYRTVPDASKTLAGLTHAFAEDPSLLQQLEVLVWDNSPTALDEPRLAFPFTYQHAARNEGVAGAYNAAARIAAQRGYEWLLLLDHDTSVTGDFLRGMLGHAEHVQADARIAAVAPYLYAGELVLSPHLWRLARHVPLPRPQGASTERRLIFAANSGTLMRIRALKTIGGYSPRFWLDYSDIYVFQRFHEAGFAVRIAGDLALQHEVALLDYDARMTPARYATYLAAESDFLDLYRGLAERVLHLLRLAVRAMRQRRFTDGTFSRMTRQELWRRLFTRRKQRLRDRG